MSYLCNILKNKGTGGREGISYRSIVVVVGVCGVDSKIRMLRVIGVSMNTLAPPSVDRKSVV